MIKYIALFRGINVGGKNKLPMKGLIALLEDLGYENIETYIQSGNVIFEAKGKIGQKVQDEISRAVFHTYGFSPKIVFLSARQLLKAIEQNPFPTDDGKALHFFFLESIPEITDLKPLEKWKVSSERMYLTEDIFYLYAPNGIGKSRLAASVERFLGVSTTARNWNTVKKLESMVKS